MDIELRPPVPEDGSAVFELIRNCPPLDTNSRYCNLLQCSHFAETSVIASLDSNPVGFISAYQIPSRIDTLFIWQVAVAESARGTGLATKMILNLLDRKINRSALFIETSITPSNIASRRLFEGIAKTFETEVATSTMFDAETHFNKHHDTEVLYRIGPLR
ncbi:diaminobutyrate acetyltransferase [Aurantivibrio infirmus]